MTFTTTVLLSIAVLCIAAIAPIINHRVRLHFASRRRKCPSPPLRPYKDFIFGLDILIAEFNNLKNNRLVREAYKSFRKYGETYGFYVFGRRTIATIDPRIVQFVLATENEKFGVGPARQAGSLPLIGRGVLTTDGELWKNGRNAIMPIFARKQIADREMFERHLVNFLARIEGRGETLDLKPLFDELILDAGSEFIFGESLDTLSVNGGPVDTRVFLDAFMSAQKVVGMRVMLGKLSYFIRSQNFWENCSLVRAYTKRQIDRAMHGDTEPKQDKKKYHLVKELAHEIHDEEALLGQLLNVFLGGRDTPAVALGNVFFCLARHSSVWCKIREEIGNASLEELSFEKLKSMRYLQYAINEGLRLYPPLPGLTRVCLTTTVIPYGGGKDGTGPVCIIPGDTVSWSIYAMHRNPEVFGPDVESFRPERWQDIRPGWNYLPFGGGARHCPAQQLAIFWVSYTIARMAMEFKEVQNRDPEMQYVETLKLVMESFNGVKVGLVRV